MVRIREVLRDQLSVIFSSPLDLALPPRRRRRHTIPNGNSSASFNATPLNAEFKAPAWLKEKKKRRRCSAAGAVAVAVVQANSVSGRRRDGGPRPAAGQISKVGLHEQRIEGRIEGA